jgi:hypothetical protein
MDTQEITAEQARQAIDADKQRRADACSAAIEKALVEHGCTVQMQPFLTDDGRIAGRVLIVAQ